MKDLEELIENPELEGSNEGDTDPVTPGDDEGEEGRKKRYPNVPVIKKNEDDECLNRYDKEGNDEDLSEEPTELGNE